MKRLFDITVSFLGLMLTVLFLIPICVLIWLQDFHSPFYIAPRVGKDGKIFKMVKLRSMIIDADKTGVDSTSSQDKRITPIGRFVRAYKLDEIPQLWNVLKGEMSFVGPRPCLQNQIDLIKTRKKYNLFRYTPGITGLSQIKGIDMSNPVLLSKTDDKMMRNFSLFKYLYYIVLTLLGSGFGDRVSNL